MTRDEAKYAGLIAGACLLAFAIIAVFIGIVDQLCALNSC